MKSFQERVPRARVNITLESQSNTQASGRELPMRILVMANHLGQEDARPLLDRPRLTIHQDNFNKIMSAVKPSLNLALKHAAIDFQFESLRGFDPEEIAKQIPLLVELAQKRELLKELKLTYRNNPELRQWMRKQLEEKR